jgi:hypothetical protein
LLEEHSRQKKTKNLESYFIYAAISPPSTPVGRDKTVNFLDLTIEITNDGEIKTKTFQKAMNLYLYLCPSSAHQPGVLNKGLIFGSLQRYWRQNSATADYQHRVHKLYDHLQDRGHREEDITPIFHEASAPGHSRT